MDPTLRSFGPRSYEDFVPPSDMIHEQEFDMILMELPGFRKEHLKVQLDNFGNLRTTGERPLDGSRWRRFRKEFRIPDNCNTSGIRAKFENSILTITLPKLTTEAQLAAPTLTPSVKPAALTPPPSAEPATPTPPPPLSPAKAEPTAPTLPTAEAPAEAPTMLKPSEAKEANGENMEAKPAEPPTMPKPTEAEEIGGGYAIGLKRQRKQLLVNIVVAVVVLVGVVIYVAYKFKKVAEAETRQGLLDYEL